MYLINHRKPLIKVIGIVIVLLGSLGFPQPEATITSPSQNPFESQIREKITQLTSKSSVTRASAAEALGYLRAYKSAEALAAHLKDPSEEVRLNLVLSLAWCGGRNQVSQLIDVLEDRDWVVRQAAWVALYNLTGMEIPFEPRESTAVRDRQVQAWRLWWSRAQNEQVPRETELLLQSSEPENRLKGLRAIGALGGPDSAGDIEHILKKYLRLDTSDLPSVEKNIVISGLRALGRLRNPESYELLKRFLQTVHWARYAADALGDFGDPRAVPDLALVYSGFALDLRYFYTVNPQQVKPLRIPKDDRATNSPIDRMYETPHAIITALSRLPLVTPRTVQAVRDISLLLLVNMPSDYDGGVLYEEESYQDLISYLLTVAGLRDTVCRAVLEAFSAPIQWKAEEARRQFESGLTDIELIKGLAKKMTYDSPFAAPWLPAFCRDPKYVPDLIRLLKHENRWVRINAAKALMFIKDPRAIEPIASLLETSRPERDYGFSGVLEHAEHNDPTPRWREAYIRALGRLGASEYDELLIDLLEDDWNVLEIQYAAALALDELSTNRALDALKRADQGHPFHSVRMAAREALWRRNIQRSRESTQMSPVALHTSAQNSRDAESLGKIVFIKGRNKMRTDYNGQAGVDPWRQTYTITNSGPTWRVGQNLHIRDSDGSVTQLTHFTTGYVADCEVSWDGDRILFSRRQNGDERHASDVPYKPSTVRNPIKPLLGTEEDPWWHIWEIKVDGTGLRQLTFGPYHDVHPVYLGNDRIVFTSSRIGMRDEYHGFPCTGLMVMNPDGSDIHPIGFNLGGDREPSILQDGRIVFSRLDNFYSRLKTEQTIQVVSPDGTRNEAFYGPERRPFWKQVHLKNAAWRMRTSYNSDTDNRNRVLRLTQPQPFGPGQVVCASSGGLVVLGPGRYQERLIPHDRKMAVTTPFPIGKNKLLCAATIKQFNIDGKIVTAGTPEFEELEKGPALFQSADNIDLGLYIMDASTGEMKLLYNDPETADFEARPIRKTRRPRTVAESVEVRNGSYTTRFFCHSARISRHERVTAVGKLLRVIEGTPFVARHETQQNRGSVLWKNHGGTHARVLGTIPLAADGSFYIEVPADRLLQLQILDSDRRVVGNQLFWMYARPNETRSCIGCHEHRNQTHLPGGIADAVKTEPIKMLPYGSEFTYRAKAWLKGSLPEEAEERNRTARAVNLIARY